MKGLLSWRTFVVLALWGATLAGAAYAGAIAYKRRADIRAVLSGSAIIQTNLYNLSVQKVSLPTQGRPGADGGIEGRDGGIAALGEGVLLADRIGRTWYVEPDRTLRELSLRIPINYDEFEEDPYNDGTTIRSRFAVKDIMVQGHAEGSRLFASYNYWRSNDECYTLRVARLDAPIDSFLSEMAAEPGDWSTLWETACVPLSPNRSGGRNPTNGIAGRLVALSDQEILVSIGGFGPATPDDPKGPYGKTVLIDLSSGEARYYTRGHRNPQGLVVSSAGVVWLTEHADRGGDELNMLVEGADYGWPNVGYGTNYESMVLENNPLQGRHEGYEKPMFSWVPSIGTSQLMIVEERLFEYWRGDILVSSLSGASLFRVRIEEDRVTFVEPIRIGHRVRDIAERADGTIVLKTDDDVLIFLSPFGAATGGETDPALRGQVLATACASCHSLEDGGTDGLGPNLWGIAGRPIASREGYAYSDALRGVEGRWTIDRLRAYLADPQAFSPGTTMETTTAYDERQIADLIAYIVTLR